MKARRFHWCKMKKYVERGRKPCRAPVRGEPGRTGNPDYPLGVNGRVRRGGSKAQEVPPHSLNGGHAPWLAPLYGASRTTTTTASRLRGLLHASADLGALAARRDALSTLAGFMRRCIMMEANTMLKVWYGHAAGIENAP